MQVKFYLPPNSVFLPDLAGQSNQLIAVYVGEARAMLIDRSLVQWEIEPEVPPQPTPPAPAETELYKVVSASRLNVRVTHSITAEIKARLQPGEEFPLETGAVFEDEDNDITWRKTYPNGWWVAIRRGGDIYAEKADTSGRAG